MKTTSIPFPVPDWAEWVAQDEDGDVRVFEHEPLAVPLDDCWYSRGRAELLATADKNPNWRETLRKV